MAPTEPINLREWKALGNANLGGRLFTCGRPGRATFGRAKVSVSVEIIDRWVNGLPKADVLHIISLLGKKTSGYSEFGYYPFGSSQEPTDKPMFETWLNERYGNRFIVYEFPTTDAQGIPPDVLGVATDRIRALLKSGHITIVIDSAGAERTARVCEALGYSPLL